MTARTGVGSTLRGNYSLFSTSSVSTASAAVVDVIRRPSYSFSIRFSSITGSRSLSRSMKEDV